MLLAGATALNIFTIKNKDVKMKKYTAIKKKIYVLDRIKDSLEDYFLIIDGGSYLIVRLEDETMVDQLFSFEDIKVTCLADTDSICLMNNSVYLVDKDTGYLFELGELTYLEGIEALNAKTRLMYSLSCAYQEEILPLYKIQIKTYVAPTKTTYPQNSVINYQTKQANQQKEPEEFLLDDDLSDIINPFTMSVDELIVELTGNFDPSEEGDWGTYFKSKDDIRYYQVCKKLAEVNKDLDEEPRFDESVKSIAKEFGCKEWEVMAMDESTYIYYETALIKNSHQDLEE